MSGLDRDWVHSSLSAAGARVRSWVLARGDRALALLGPYEDRARTWLRWFLFGETAWDWLRPRRALLPAASFFGLFALFGLHRPLARTGGKCTTVADCGRVLDQLASGGTGELLELAGTYLLAVAAVYVLAVAVTGAVGHVVDLRGRYPWLFAPDDEELLAVAVALVAAVLTYAAGVTGAAYSLLGAAVLYVVYFPSLGSIAGLYLAAQANPLAGSTGILVTVLELAVGVGAILLAGALQVLWLYALAHGAVRAMRAEL